VAKNNLSDSIVKRTYRCLSCKTDHYFEQKASEKFKKKCPNCGKRELYIHEASSSVGIDMKKVKTVGMLADINTRRMEKEGTLPQMGKKKRPWWRKSDKIDQRILKDPIKYIETGKK
jgi:DNA-directed RNA polymerase subunit RPC12/RpoP